MIIAKNDEAKRSKIWRIVTSVSSLVIVLIAVFFLTKMFTNNPLEGKWIGEEGRVNLIVKKGDVLTVEVLELGEGVSVSVDMKYTLNRDSKTVAITTDEARVQEVLESDAGLYEEKELRNVLDSLSTTFDYSVDQEQLTLSEREYGEQMIFIKN